MNEEVKDLIAAKLDVYQLLDILELDVPELLEYLDERLDQYSEELRRATN